MVLNIIVMVGFILHYVSSYNLSYDFGKPGDKSKLKQLLVIIGAPLFITLFMITYLNGMTVAFGPKILIEILFIIVGYVELHEIEKEAKDEFERKGVLAKILPLARSNKGHYYQYWATLYRTQEIVRELGTDELKRIAMDALISQDLDSFQCSGSNLVQIRKHMDPLHDIKGAEWGGVYPTSLIDIQFQRWKDEGQNLDALT